MVIDFHTHIFPEKIAKKAVAVLEDNIYKASGKKEYAYHGATEEELIRAMDKSGVDISVVMPIATSPRQEESINAFAKEVNASKRLFSFGSVHPRSADPEKTIEDIKQKGLLGIKLHPEYQDLYIDSPEGIRILKKCAALGLYVMLHTGLDKGIKEPCRCTPEMLYNALCKVPEVKIIAAHMGGLMMWDRVYEVLCGEDIYIDTSYAVGIMDNALCEKMIAKHGDRRILFASDSPWTDQAWAKKALLSLGLGEEINERIFYKNAKEILGI